MPLSPREERALAALEEDLRADDPAFAAALAATPPARRSFLPSTSALHLLSLLAALGGLIAAGTLAGGRPVVLAAVTAALLLPWLVWTTRSLGRRSHAGPRLRRGRTTGPGRSGRATA